MITLMLTIHVVALVISIFATTIMVVLTLLSRATPGFARRTNLFITGVGIALGGILLIQHPVGSRCIELTSYLVIFVFAYRFISTRSTQLATSAPDVIVSR